MQSWGHRGIGLLKGKLYGLGPASRVGGHVIFTSLVGGDFRD